MTNTTCPTCGSDCNERDELEKAEREIERLRGIVPEVLERLNDEMCDENERLRAELAAAKEGVVQDMVVQALRAENKALRAHITNQNKELDELIPMAEKLEAENEALRADAERYRWLRRPITSTADFKKWLDIITNLCEDRMDAAIDAAIDVARSKP